MASNRGFGYNSNMKNNLSIKKTSKARTAKRLVTVIASIAPKLKVSKVEILNPELHLFPLLS